MAVAGRLFPGLSKQGLNAGLSRPEHPPSHPPRGCNNPLTTATNIKNHVSALRCSDIDMQRFVGFSRKIHWIVDPAGEAR